nr:MAG TPA: hypothetical protein [Caudoviricetes sp.]
MIITPANMINISSTLTTPNATTQIPLTPITTTLQHNPTPLSPIARQPVMPITILPSHKHQPPKGRRGAKPTTAKCLTPAPRNRRRAQPKGKKGGKNPQAVTLNHPASPKPNAQQSPQHRNAGIKPTNHTGQEGNYLTQARNQKRNQTNSENGITK